ncbi:MAG TPA: carbohydrate ABC transporter permease [Capsulimonadaceae bacterium]|jgi:multiple sugar transport system permease protein
MALIPVVGRKSPKMRLLVAFIYVVLILGAVTTLYPFLVMLGSSVTSEYDQDQYAVLPAYLTSDAALFGKYACDKYGQDIGVISSAYATQYAKLNQVSPPTGTLDKAAVTRWRAFLDHAPTMYKSVGFMGTKGQYSPSLLMDRYHDWLRIRFHDDIRALDLAYVEEDTSFLTVYPPYERPLQRLFAPGASRKETDWAEFKRTLPADMYLPVLLNPLYRAYLRDEVYGGKIEDLNTAWRTSYGDWMSVTLPFKEPVGGAAKDWAAFARTKCPLRFLIIGQPYVSTWERFQKARGLSPVPYPAPGSLPTGPSLRAFSDFVKAAPPDCLLIASLENQWWMTMGDPAARPPLAQSDWLAVQADPNALRRSYLARNYKFALDYLLLHGRGVLNTVIYCGGAVLIALIVNPLCAYALSRFKLPYTQGLLLFLLSTMAFPAEVAMIPNFLLLKQLGLLNTFWALILPAAASGFSIFLLKGFFDSLPQDLYEAGMLDGASELTLFARVTLPLSKPIFAVIALQAFTAAYGAFLFAMIVCQAQSHWTLMVWIYQFQALNAPQYVMMAALVIAAIPTLVVFMFTQKIIMRGIILPSMK